MKLASSTLIQKLIKYLNLNSERLGWWSERLDANSPVNRLRLFKHELDQQHYNLLKTFNLYIDKKKTELRQCHLGLKALSPVAILNRGYSITRTIPETTVITDPASVSINQNLEVMVAKGRLFCRVKGKSDNGKENL